MSDCGRAPAGARPGRCFRVRRLAPLLLLAGLMIPACLWGPSGHRAPDRHGSPGSRAVEFTYGLTLRGLPERARQVSIWVPLPRETSAQRIEDMRVDADIPGRVLSDPTYGNRFLYFESEGSQPESLKAVIRFVVRREAVEVRGAPSDRRVSALEIDPALHLRPDRLVPTDALIAERARRVLSGVRSGGVGRARRLYDDVVRTMVYDKSGTGWGRGDALHACEVGAGNCTDFHSLFIGMARAVQIPAVFVMGFPLPAERGEGAISSYHCWAEFYDDRLGWVPIDASEAWKHPESKEFLFGGLDPNRIEFTIGRDIQLVPQDKARGAVLNYSIYPYVLVDGESFAGVVTEFRFRDIAG